ncbi:MAG: hypothetical protein OXG05_04110 [Gammaproteobacteria bacterium]|nr:hypothetical protein [Gammaproteobacteria bacterium]
MKSTKSNVEGNTSQNRKRASALAAMHRAAKVAHRRAAERGDKIAISRNRKVVWIDPIVDD